MEEHLMYDAGIIKIAKQIRKANKDKHYGKMPKADLNLEPVSFKINDYGFPVIIYKGE